MQVYTHPKQHPDREAINAWLDAPPPWRDRRFDHDANGDKVLRTSVHRDVPANLNAERRGATYVPTSDVEVETVNLALLLRRPLLVTGDPGIGKSTLAYGIAFALGLGAPLRWEINSRTTLQDGLYTYDAVGHFREASRSEPGTVLASKFIRLGPLGTAFVPTKLPRVLLVDELDKASWDLPNDLLHIFEEGEFLIPELTRQREPALVQLHDSTRDDDVVELPEGRVSALHHPVVVITSNEEREFSGAFMRRCVSLKMEPLAADKLVEVVKAQLGDKADDMINRVKDGGLATDVALQSLFATLNEFPFEKALELLKSGR